jgi:hypothetical protein
MADDDFGKEVRELREAALEADKTNRDEALLDLEFAGLKQWDDRVRQMREQRGDKPPLPCLTIDTTNQLIGQVVGDRRANQTSIKVLPREDGDKQVAEIRSELIRSIELQSKAQRVYAQAFEQAVTCGQGNFRVDLDYAYEDAFERDIFIRGIPNPMAVLWDPLAGDPTGRDATYCFVEERMRPEDYKARFGEDASSLQSDTTMRGTDWVDSETVLVAELHRITEKSKTVALTIDGKTVEIADPEAFEKVSTELGEFFTDGKIALAINQAKGEPYMRETKCKYATRILTNGKEELDDKFEMKLPRLPIIRVMGREVWIGNKRVRFGLMRAARDQQRLKNYLRSVAAEKLMFAPRHSYLVEAGSIDGMEGDYGANVLTYKKGAQPPQEATLNNMQALVQMSEMFSQDMKDVTGIHDASLGIRSNETSGVAIRARQGEGDIATIIYHDNMSSSQQEAGDVINEMIPLVFDTARTIRTVGEDDATKLIKINHPNDPESIDLSIGRYDVTVATGPAYMTKRIEAAQNMIDAAQVAPQLWAVAGDLIALAQDWPQADKIAERLKKGLPPQFQEEDEEEQSPEQLQAKAQAQAEEAEMKALARRTAAAQAEEAEARADKAKAEAAAARAKPQIDGFNAETQRIRAITAKDFPLPTEAVALLTPIVTDAIMKALGSPDILPLQPDEEHMLAEGVMREAANKEANEQAAVNGAEEGTE